MLDGYNPHSRTALHRDKPMHVHDLKPWQHRHVFDRGNALAMRNTWRVAALTAVMMVGEIIAGWMFNSMALLADGWHMSTHALAIGLTGLAYFLSRRLANDERFAFGTWKIEILSSFTSALLLGVVAIAMVLESFSRLLHPVSISFDQALWVAILGLLVNVLSAWLLSSPSGHGHAHDHAHGHGHGHDDLNLKAAYVHVVTDAFTSVLAIIALLAGKYAGWSWLDPLMGVVGAAVILVWAYRLIGESSCVLLDREMDHHVVAEIRQSIEADGDAKLTDLHVWRVGRNHYACIVSLVADQPLFADVYRKRLQQHHELAHISIEVNPCAGAAPQAR